MVRIITKAVQFVAAACDRASVRATAKEVSIQVRIDALLIERNAVRLEKSAADKISAHLKQLL